MSKFEEILKSAKSFSYYDLESLIEDLQKMSKTLRAKECNKHLVGRRHEREGFLKEDWYYVSDRITNLLSNRHVPESEIQDHISDLKSIPYLKKGTRFTFICPGEQGDSPGFGWQVADNSTGNKFPWKRDDYWAERYLENIRELPIE